MFLEYNSLGIDPRFKIFLFRMTESSDSAADIVYSFSYKQDYGWLVRVYIDHQFPCKSDMKILERFSHKQRCDFAKYIMKNFKDEKYLSLTENDLINSFARYLSTIFKRGIQIYWIKCPIDTVVIITSLDTE